MATHYEDLVCQYDWPCNQAVTVMRCESSGNARAYNAGNYGLFQLNAVHAGRVGGDPSAFYDPETNVRVAHDLFRDSGGWGPWACKP